MLFKDEKLKTNDATETEVLHPAQPDFKSSHQKGRSKLHRHFLNVRGGSYANLVEATVPASEGQGIKY